MSDLNVFDPVALPELKHVLDRSKVRPNIERVYFPEASISQGTDMNDALSIEANRRKAIGDMIAADGDRLNGADIIVDSVAGTVTITDGRVYLLGAPRDIAGDVLTGVPMTGDVKVGVRYLEVVITAEDDDIFLGQDPDAEESFGEAGAIRTEVQLTWGYDSDGGAGTLFPYVTLRNGQIISQDAPPTLSGIAQQIAIYDYDSHENYIVRGCSVSPLGNIGGEQVFSIAEGTANVLGFKIQRPVSNRYSVSEDADVGTVDSEPHTFDDAGSGTATIQLRRTPLASINSVIITKQRTVSITKGVTNAIDALPDDSISSIISVVQGGTTYVQNTDYKLTGDGVDWSLGGAEPITGSSYNVTYRYLDAATPTDVTQTSLKVAGGVTGQPVFIGYSYKLPRVDRICLDNQGNIVYLKGISAPDQPQPPAVPKTVVNLARIENSWFGTPVVINDGDLAVSVALERKVINRVLDLLNIVTLQKQALDINIRSAGQATGTFSDPLTSDYYRDAGEVQNGAVFNGSFQIPIIPTFEMINLSGPLFLSFSPEKIVSQELVSGCEFINPYQAFEPMPAILRIVPAQDYWTEQQTIWLSEQTRVFGSGNQSRVVDVEVIEDVQSAPIRYLRQIQIAFTIKDFGPGEVLTGLTFDGISVLPGPAPVADGNGDISGAFTIPANVTSGIKEVVATGGSGTQARARFEGEGRIETLNLQKVTTVERFQRDPLDRGNVANGPYDPQAQSFSLIEGRHISSVDLKFCRIGDRDEPVVVQFVTMDNGFPTTEIIAQAEVDMNSVLVDEWTTFNFAVPFYLPSNQFFAFVVATNDPDHSIAVANRGDFDAIRQQWIASQPYTVGTRFSSSNAISWTVHQDSDVTFRLNAALFAPLAKTVNLGTYTATDCSDLLIRADVFLPEDVCSVIFEVTFGSETPIRILPDQVWERDSFFTGNVNIKAILKGSAKASPVVGSDVLVIFGEMQANGVYVSRSFDIGTAVEVDVIASTKLPVGSTLAVEVDANNDVWTALAQTLATPIDDGYIERTYKKDPFTAATGGRLRLTLTGTPAARPSIADLRAFTF